MNSLFFTNILLALPLYLLITAGYLLARFAGWTGAVSEGLTRFVFSVALPVTLFHLMTGLARLPAVDIRLLVAFFGGCLMVFAISRLVGKFLFSMNGEAQTLFGLGGIFSNNVMLGIPFAVEILGNDALPSVALILTFNSLILWTLVTISIEWAQHGTFSINGILKTFKAVLKNPIVLGIASGSLYGFSGMDTPVAIEKTLGMVSASAIPLALISLGMGLVEFKTSSEWKISGTITFIKLIVHPLIVYLLAVLLKLPALETKVVILLSSLSVGANVFLMARQFKVLEGATSAGLLASTVLSALTTPLLLSILG